MSIRAIHIVALIGCGLAVAAGCMVPAYRNPAGFSSSYHRQIYGPERYSSQLHEPPLPPPASEGVFFPASVRYAPVRHRTSQSAVEPHRLADRPTTRRDGSSQ